MSRQTSELQSICCGAPIRQSSGADFHDAEDDPIGYVTQFYLCRGCGQPCDAEPFDYDLAGE